MAAQEPVTLTLAETGEKISKPLDGKPDKYGQRYFKYITNEAGEEEQIEITRGEFKNDRKLHVTVRHRELPRCGHKLVLGTEPRHRNCEVCWFTFFQLHGELVQSLDEAYAKHGTSWSEVCRKLLTVHGNRGAVEKGNRRDTKRCGSK